MNSTTTKRKRNARLIGFWLKHVEHEALHARAKQQSSSLSDYLRALIQNEAQKSVESKQQ